MPDTRAVPAPVSTVAATTFNGVSGNGFASFAVTSTCIARPCWASVTRSSLADAGGRDVATTVTATPRGDGVGPGRPSVTVTPTVAVVPAAPTTPR